MSEPTYTRAIVNCSTLQCSRLPNRLTKGTKVEGDTLKKLMEIEAEISEDPDSNAPLIWDLTSKLPSRAEKEEARLEEQRLQAEAEERQKAVEEAKREREEAKAKREAEIKAAEDAKQAAKEAEAKALADAKAEAGAKKSTKK